MISFCGEVVNPNANFCAYEMSKAGIIMLTKLWQTLLVDHVKVTVLAY